MKKNMHSSHDMARFSVQKHKSNEIFLNNIWTEVKEIKADLKQYTFHLKMKCVDISDFFPLESDRKLEEFLDKSHEDWESRKTSFMTFYTMLLVTKRRGLLVRYCTSCSLGISLGSTNGQCLEGRTGL